MISNYYGIAVNSRKLEFTLIEGRNRQIRKMVEAVGLNVVALHRVSFGGIKLKGAGLAEGDWVELDENEMEVVQRAIELIGDSRSDGEKNNLLNDDELVEIYEE